MRTFGAPIGQDRGFVSEFQHLGAQLCTIEHFSLGYIYSVIASCIHVKPYSFLFESLGRLPVNTEGTYCREVS